MLRLSAALLCASAIQLVSPPGAAALDNPPGKSGGGDKEASVIVTNSLDKPISVVWVDGEGKERELSEVGARGTMKLTTYNTHLFRFKVDGQTLGEYRVGDAANQSYEVKTGRTAKPAPSDAPAHKATICSQLSPAEAKELVAYHNKARKDVGVGPVTWSPKIAEFAQAWADECARTGEVKHRPREGEFAQKYGENLAYGFGPTYGVMKGAAGWYAEIKSYTPGDPVPRTPPKDATGHYTQMVWKKSTKIGAGKAVFRTGQYKGWTLLVCNYDPPGNYVDETPY
jgi:pathogenesis-related protein 1